MSAPVDSHRAPEAPRPPSLLGSLAPIVALIGMVGVMGVSSPAAAGAVICGAYFGDGVLGFEVQRLAPPATADEPALPVVATVPAD